MIRRLFFFVTSVALLLAIGVVFAMRMVPSDPQDQAAMARSLLDVDEFQSLIRGCVLDGLKQEYVSQHHWGQQAATKPHVELRGKWYKPRLEKADKPVNDGLWQKFVVTLVDPTDNLQTRVEDISATPDGRFEFSFWMRARINGNGQFQHWVKGVRLFDVSEDLGADVAVRIRCLVGIRRESGGLVDDVVLSPQVTAVEPQLVDLDLKRLGRLGHDISREVGQALTPTIQHELDRRQPHFVEKANASIAKHPERLRFSPDRFLASGWAKLQTALAGRDTGQNSEPRGR